MYVQIYMVTWIALVKVWSMRHRNQTQTVPTQNKHHAADQTLPCLA